MEEMMVMTREDPHTFTNQTINYTTTTTSTLPTWKLYDNPYYYTQHHHHQHHHSPLYLPLSARKIAACLWDLTFVRSIMDSDLNIARAKIIELKAELDYERKLRNKVESVNKKLYREVYEEKKRRENVENVCEKLAKDISSVKLEIDRMKKEMSQEKKMLRMAESFREERVQMKLAEAKILFEEKLTELELSKAAVQLQVEPPSPLKVKKPKDNEPIILPCCENSIASDNNGQLIRSATKVSKRRASPEAENPHIKRGIKGFVEYPRVVRAMSSRGRQLGSKVECQKAQLRFLLRQKSPITTDNLIMG